MNINSLTILAMREEHIREIARWRYDGVYAFYNRPEIAEDEPVEIPENSYAVYDGEEMIGHFHLGEDGQIPTVENYAYTPDYMDIGLGLRPDLCGQGIGENYVNFILEYARSNYDCGKFRLSVAAFNERAIKVYKKAGFTIICEVTNSYFKNKFYIMTLE